MQKPINRWMKMSKSKNAWYPHFVLFQDENGYRTACGRIHTWDMRELTKEELALIKQDPMARCGACDYSPRSAPP
jgi:hypothetical protein